MKADRKKPGSSYTNYTGLRSYSVTNDANSTNSLHCNFNSYNYCTRTHNKRCCWRTVFQNFPFSWRYDADLHQPPSSSVDLPWSGAISAIRRPSNRCQYLYHQRTAIRIMSFTSPCQRKPRFLILQYFHISTLKTTTKRKIICLVWCFH